MTGEVKVETEEGEMYGEVEEATVLRHLAPMGDPCEASWQCSGTKNIQQIQ
jgi:hypothetical protein